ncbi:MAG: hypothetical protein U5L09_06740 [Bacteroidales bacterium]|nr:hypothetical protein [Bacteroidales bacterium]
MKSLLCLIFVFLMQPGTGKGQDSALMLKKRKQLVTAGAITLYGGSMYMLYHAWYKNYEQSPFHFHNDNDNWMYMDKGGHILHQLPAQPVGPWCGTLGGIQ